MSGEGVAMNNLNSILIEGNLTQDPESMITQSGRSLCTFSIASNRYYRNASKDLINEVSYIDIDTWGSLAEGCARNLKKGIKVRVVGRLKHDRWSDEQGNARERYVIVAEHVEFHPEQKADQEEDSETSIELTDEASVETPVAKKSKKS